MPLSRVFGQTLDREFNQDVSKIKRASLNGPVFITDRGCPAHVLLTMRDYQKLTKTKESIIDLLAMPTGAKIDFQPPKLNKEIHHPENFEYGMIVVTRNVTDF